MLSIAAQCTDIQFDAVQNTATKNKIILTSIAPYNIACYTILDSTYFNILGYAAPSKTILYYVNRIWYDITYNTTLHYTTLYDTAAIEFPTPGAAPATNAAHSAAAK